MSAKGTLDPKEIERLVIADTKRRSPILANVRFGSKADMCGAQADVRYVPIADIGFNSITSSPPASKWRSGGL